MVKSLIVCTAKNNVIGNKGKIPWKIKGEQKRFKELTLNHTVVLGRKAFDEIGHPLKNRQNIILSRSVFYQDERCKTATNFQDILKLVKKDETEVFICGGLSVYKYFLENDLVDKIYLTIIDKDFQGDVVLDGIDLSKFTVLEEETINSVNITDDKEEPIIYKNYTYIRK